MVWALFPGTADAWPVRRLRQALIAHVRGRATGKYAALIGKQLPLPSAKEHLVIRNLHPWDEVDSSYDSDWRVFIDATRLVGVPLDYIHVQYVIDRNAIAVHSSHTSSND